MRSLIIGSSHISNDENSEQQWSSYSSNTGLFLPGFSGDSKMDILSIFQSLHNLKLLKVEEVFISIHILFLEEVLVNLFLMTLTFVTVVGCSSTSSRCLQGRLHAI